MASAQTLDLRDRRVLAAWAADCAERVLAIFEAEAASDQRARDGIARARAFARGELDAAGEIGRRFEAGRAAGSASSRAAKAAARSAGQASGVAHMGAHALGAAAFAAQAAELAAAGAGERERYWQLEHVDDDVRSALRHLPVLGTDAAGPLGTGLLASGALGAHIRALQRAIGSIER